MPVLLVVPARLGSTRLSRKPLQPLGGAPLIARVLEQAGRVQGIDRLVLATDTDEIAAVAAGLGIEVCLTSDRHESGTDRIAEVAQRPGFESYDVVINLQGDEPFLPLAAVDGALAMIAAGFDIGTAAAPLDPAHRHDPALVKVVTDGAGKAHYFSRSAIPHLRDEADAAQAQWWQHLGIYAYRREVLLAVTALPPSPLERLERLEQLRALDAGYRIGVAHLTDPAPAGIDTPADLAAAERHWTTLHPGT